MARCKLNTNKRKLQCVAVVLSYLPRDVMGAQSSLRFKERLNNEDKSIAGNNFKASLAQEVPPSFIVPWALIVVIVRDWIPGWMGLKLIQSSCSDALQQYKTV